MFYSDVIGQEAAKQHLRQMIGEERIPHALMFCGPQGAGKLPLALAFAAHLLCEHPNPEGPCGTCASCQMVRQWAHPDLHFSFPVYKKKPTDNTTSDDYLPQWREQLEQSVYFGIEEWLADIKAENQQIMHYVGESDSLQRKLALKASQGGRRVVLLWLPERMKTEMANKLLKIIEEPPTQTYFLLVSEEPDNVLGTIQSRVQRINVPALSESDVAETLMNQFALSEAEAKVAAHVAQGNYTAALARQQVSSEEKTFFDLFVQLMRLSYSRQVRELRQWSETVADMGRERQKRMLAYCQRLIRENFIYNFHRPEMSFETAEESQFSTRFAPFINERNVIGITTELADAQRDIEQNVNARIVFFDFALKMIILLKQ